MSKLVQIYCQNTDIALSLISQFLLCNPPSYFEELNQIHNILIKKEVKMIKELLIYNVSSFPSLLSFEGVFDVWDNEH